MGRENDSEMDGDFIQTLSDEDLVSYLTDTTKALRRMCDGKEFSALSEVYGLAVSLLERRKCQQEFTPRRMTG